MDPRMTQFYPGSPPFSGHMNGQRPTHPSMTMYPAPMHGMVQMVPYTMMVPQPIQTFNRMPNQPSSIQPLGSPAPQQQSTPVLTHSNPYSASHPSPPAHNHSHSMPAQPHLNASASHPPVANLVPASQPVRATSTGHSSTNTEPVKTSPASAPVVTDLTIPSPPAGPVQTKSLLSKPSSSGLDITKEQKKFDVKRRYLAGKAQFEKLEGIFEDISSEFAKAEAKNQKLLAKKTALLRELMKYEGQRIRGGVVRVDYLEKKHPSGKRSRGFARCMQPRAKDGGLCYHPILTARDRNKVPCHGAAQHANTSAKKRRSSTKAKD